MVAIYNSENVKLASCKYDAWGACSVTVLDASATAIANLNPFRYRSYYYDTETNLYFLKTRYYDPELARFMTIDAVRYLNSKAMNGLNLYAYCHNNPIIYIDSDGTDAILITAYCRQGLPIVGHTALAVQNEYGAWYIVEYTGGDKPSAKIVIDFVQDDIYKIIDERYRAYTSPGFNSDFNLKRILSYFIHSSHSYNILYLEGNYAGSLSKANEYQSEDPHWGGYDPLFNNCAQFVCDILKSSNNSNIVMDFYHKNYITIIPSIFHFETKFVASIVMFFEDVYQQIVSWFK